MSRIFSIGQESTSAGKGVVWRDVAAVEVGHSEACQADEGGHMNEMTPSVMNAS
jgi:hypothetical protein